MALTSTCTKDAETSRLEPPIPSSQQVSTKMPTSHASGFSSPWGVDDLLQLSDFESSDKVSKIPFYLHNCLLFKLFKVIVGRWTLTESLKLSLLFGRKGCKLSFLFMEVIRLVPSS